MKAELWLPVENYEGLYEVSDLGRVRSLDRTVVDKGGKRTRRFKGRVLNNICGNTGYHFISLHKNSTRKERKTVHRLVMETFNPSKDGDKTIVDHINGIRSDNRLDNLRWTDFFTNNRNTPYIRYLQGVLEQNQITYIKEDEFEGNTC